MKDLPEHLHSIARILPAGHYNIVIINNIPHAKSILGPLYYAYRLTEKAELYDIAERELKHSLKEHKDERSWVNISESSFQNDGIRWEHVWYFDNTPNITSSFLN